MSALFALFCAAAVTTSPDVTLIDFRSDSCGPCRAMDPIIHEMQAAGVPIRIVDVNREPAIAQQFRVGPIPCFVVVANGKEVTRQTGSCSRGELENMLRLGQAATGAPRDEARNRGGSNPTPLQFVNDSASSKPRLNGVPRGGANIGQMLELEPPRAAKPGLREVQERSPLPDDAAQQPKIAGQSSSANDQAIPAGLRDDLLQTSVRLILHDDRGRATGSGTVIDCREGEALILTCGHIFREWSERGRVSVDFFDGAAERSVPARVIKYDLKSDVALVSVSTRRTLRVARVAGTSTRMQKGESVLAAGCEHGADVAAFPSRITQIDKYLGPPNLCIAGQPKQGRSGGGLFNSQGQVIGVCNAADQEDNEGLYASLGAIQQLLDATKLDFVYREDAPTPAFAREFERQLTHEPPTMPSSMPTADREDRLRSEAAVATMDRRPTPLQFPTRNANTGSSAGSFAANSGATPAAPSNALAAVPPIGTSAVNELVVIVRDEKTANPQGRVVHLRNVSPDLLARLAEEEKQQLAQVPMAMPVPPRGANTNLLPKPGGLRRDINTAPVSFQR